MNIIKENSLNRWDSRDSAFAEQRIGLCPIALVPAVFRWFLPPSLRKSRSDYFALVTFCPEFHSQLRASYRVLHAQEAVALNSFRKAGALGLC